MKKFLIYTTLLFFMGILFAQEVPEKTDITISEPLAISKNENSSYSQDILSLESKLDNCEKSFDRINSTYQWSIGIVLTVLIAFLSITGFNYHRNYQAELKKIRDELESEYKKQCDDLLSKSAKQISDRYSIQEKNLKKQINELKVKILELELNSINIQGNKLRKHLELLEVYVDLDWSYCDCNINDQFTAIENIIDSGTNFDHFDYDEYHRIISKVPDRFNSQKERLAKIVKFEK